MNKHVVSRLVRGLLEGAPGEEIARLVDPRTRSQAEGNNITRDVIAKIGMPKLMKLALDASNERRQVAVLHFLNHACQLPNVTDALLVSEVFLPNLEVVLRSTNQEEVLSEIFTLIPNLMRLGKNFSIFFRQTFFVYT
eukprot:UN04379